MQTNGYNWKANEGFCFVDPIGFHSDKDIGDWLQLSIDHNPFAKSSKKK
jgi:hypothetical protein